MTRALRIPGSIVAVVAAAGCNESVAPPEPITVTAVNPASDLLSGGTEITITGINFTDVISVTIGGSELVNRTVVSATQITGSSPAASDTGPVDVVVMSSTHGSGTCRGCFNYRALALQTGPLAAGLYHTCGLTTAGAPYCWGDNSLGQLGVGTTTNSSTPVPVSDAVGQCRVAAP